MKRNLLFLVLSFVFLCADAQPPSDLRIETFLLPVKRTDTTTVAVRFTNLTSHQLELPNDNVSAEGIPVPNSPMRGLYYPQSIFSCVPIPGSISFRYLFVAKNPETTTLCSESGVVHLTGPAPDVLQRAKSWTRLEPGESVTRMMKLDRALPIQTGSFDDVRAVYRSPRFSAAEEQQLQQAGITTPTGDYVSTNGFSFRTDGQSVILTNKATPRHRREAPASGSFAGS